MSAVDKLITRIEEQAERLAGYQQLDDKRRARIYELEGQLVKANAERDKALADVQHWRQARQDAIAAGELMQAEIVSLRQQLDTQRQDVDAMLAEIERLRTFVGKVRDVYSKAHPNNWMTMLRPALNQLDANSSVTLTSSTTRPEGGK